jgi:hypothetical protein
MRQHSLWSEATGKKNPTISTLKKKKKEATGKSILENVNLVIFNSAVTPRRFLSECPARHAM